MLAARVPLASNKRLGSLQLRQPSLGWEVQSFVCTAFSFVCWRTDQHF